MPFFSNMAKSVLVSRKINSFYLMAPSGGIKRLKANECLVSHGTWLLFFVLFTSGLWCDQPKMILSNGRLLVLQVSKILFSFSNTF